MPSRRFYAPVGEHSIGERDSLDTQSYSTFFQSRVNGFVSNPPLHTPTPTHTGICCTLNLLDFYVKFCWKKRFRLHFCDNPVVFFEKRKNEKLLSLVADRTSSHKAQLSPLRGKGGQGSPLLCPLQWWDHKKLRQLLSHFLHQTLGFLPEGPSHLPASPLMTSVWEQGTSCWCSASPGWGHAH